MDILVIGSGGREHALVWKLKQSAKVKTIFVAPGNGGTATIATNVVITKSAEIIDWLKSHSVDLVVVGPDDYLAEGLVDQITLLGTKAFGPTKAAAEIEWSKSFAKQLMKEEGIPTAGFAIFKDLAEAKKYIQTQNFPLVIKANGLALGKGVIIAPDLAAAEAALQGMMADKLFGTAGDEVVIEECLVGREISIHAFCDSNGAVLFPTSQDHKRIFANDQGPNTGGMGTIGPVPIVTAEEVKMIADQIVLPTLAALKKRSRPFRGLLYPGIMLTAAGPKVIEFNARFGDPETQTYMRLLESDLAEILLACAEDRLADQNITWSNGAACCVVLASGGYPGSYEKGKVIFGLDAIAGPNIIVFHAGTKITDSHLVTNGGRVLGVTAVGDDLKQALAKAYQAIDGINFDGKQYRSDIGAKVLA